MHDPEEEDTKKEPLLQTEDSIQGKNAQTTYLMAPLDPLGLAWV